MPNTYDVREFLSEDECKAVVGGAFLNGCTTIELARRIEVAVIDRLTQRPTTLVGVVLSEEDERAIFAGSCYEDLVTATESAVLAKLAAPRDEDLGRAWYHAERLLSVTNGTLEHSSELWERGSQQFKDDTIACAKRFLATLDALRKTEK